MTTLTFLVKLILLDLVTCLVILGIMYVCLCALVNFVYGDKEMDDFFDAFDDKD